MSATEFEAEIVQRVLVGPAPTGGELEVMYASVGRIAGIGKNPTYTGQPTMARIGGAWNLDKEGRTCSSFQVGDIQLPYRCQYWYKLADKYYISDSDVDRSAKVLSRTIK